MITHHLNPAQREALQAWLNTEARGKRTPSDAYIKANNAFAKIPVCARPSPKSIAMTATGFGPREVVPLHGFHAVRDLPEGWAVINTYDSGGNHTIVNAAQSLHTRLWNFWSAAPDSPLDLHLGVVTPGKPPLLKELHANKLTYP